MSEATKALVEKLEKDNLELKQKLTEHDKTEKENTQLKVEVAELKQQLKSVGELK